MNNTLVLALFSMLSMNAIFSQPECFEIVDANSIIAITDDSEFIWCGTEEDGLMRIDKSDFSKTQWNTFNSGITNDRIKSVFSYDAKILLSSDSSLMLIEDSTIYSLNDTIEGLLASDQEGNLLIAGRRDFYMLNPDGNIIYAQNLMEIVLDACCSQITDIDVDIFNHVWLSHKDFYEYDVLRFDGVSWDVFDVNNSILPQESAYPNQITSNGQHIYSSSGNGVYEYDGDAWTLFHSEDNPRIESNQDDLSEFLVMPLKSDVNGVLWAGASSIIGEDVGKIAFQENDKWSFINSGMTPFSAINIFQESVMDSNDIYVGTSEGLIIMDKKCLFLSTSVDATMGHEELRIYPIPSSDLLYIEYNQRIQRIEVYDIEGRILSTHFEPNQIELTNLSPGIYIMKIYSFDNSITTRILKE